MISRPGEGSTAMGFYNSLVGDGPYLTSLASRYALGDNYHQAVVGGTTANPTIAPTGRDNLPNPIMSSSNPYVPLNSPAIADLIALMVRSKPARRVPAGRFVLSVTSTPGTMREVVVCGCNWESVTLLRRPGVGRIWIASDRICAMSVD
jgi:hypothetical protein